MIDLRRLQTLRVLAQHQTVTSAAAVLHLTPSAVSWQLRQLSAELGVALVSPHGRGVRLTPAAHTLIARADELYARWEQIEAELAATSKGVSGMLRLCGFSTAASAVLPPVVSRLGESWPNLAVRIIEAAPADCFDLLLADEADVAVVVATPGLPPTTDERFEQRSLLDDPLDLVVPEGHPLATNKTVRLTDAADQPWVVARPGSPYHQLVLSACAAAGFTPVIAHEASEWDTGAALIARGFGVGLIPRLAHLPAGYATVRVPLHGDPIPVRRILTCVRRGSAEQPAIAAALRTLTTVADTIASQADQLTNAC
ncbi:MAG: LysR family transcriptional regulator [Streptosporangiales bacterium]